MISTKTPLENLIDDTHQLVCQLQSVGTALTRVTSTAAALNVNPEEKWVREYGETVTKAKAAKIFNKCPKTIANWVADGKLQETPDGDIIIRSAAQWANSLEAKNRRQLGFRIAK